MMMLCLGRAEDAADVDVFWRTSLHTSSPLQRCDHRIKISMAIERIFAASLLSERKQSE